MSYLTITGRVNGIRAEFPKISATVEIGPALRTILHELTPPMSLRTVFQPLFRHTLNSVYFGIALMVLIACYVAIGSGATSVRAYFEMSDVQFFSAWPLKVLMAL